MSGALVPTRPPLRIEEGLIEVGWGGSLEAEAMAMAGETANSKAVSPPAAGQKNRLDLERTTENEPDLPSEEMIEDHYAALQAWTEWAKNRGRTISPIDLAGSDHAEPARASKATLVPSNDERVRMEEYSEQGLRAEHQHEHAPYSQLFSRLRQSR
jgi:general secretion pathway protein A